MPAPGLRKSVDPIAGEPSPRGLLGSCVEVITTSDPHELNGTETLSLSCADANTWFDCPVAPDVNPVSKVFDRPRVTSFEPITVYAGVTCSTLGMSYDEGQTRALEQLRLGEGRALEAFYQARSLCTYATGNDLTPAAGALSVTAGIGALESWLATNYGGQGVLHIPVGAAAMLSRDHIVDDFDSPRTLAGNCVVLGSGYAANVGPATLPATGCVTAPAGEMFAYITPPVRIRRDAPYLVVPNEGQGVRTSTNDRYALAESTFVVETACAIAAVVRLVLC